ncbi:MAG: DnaD domain protein [Enterococcus sp.]
MLSLKDFLQSGQTTISNLLLKNYHRIGLTSDEFLFVLHLHMAQSQGNGFPDLVELAYDMGIKSEQIYQLLNNLVTKGFVKIETQTIEGKKVDRYDLFPIYEHLEQFIKHKEQKKEEASKEVEIRNLYRMFEQEFGRPLSPIEFQRIEQWLSDDHYAPTLLELALREAVLNQAYSFNYIDRILLSWEKRNLKTKQQVEEDQKRRKQQLLQKEVGEDSQKTVPKVSLKNWLDE